jgi:hypothetical protein
MNYERGSDLDGVIAVNHLNKADFRPYKLEKYYAQSIPSVHSQIEVDVIITGRKLKFLKVTMDWLRRYKIFVKKVIMMPNGMKKTNKTLAEYKAKYITLLGLKEYYEADYRICQFLNEHCRGCTIYYVNGEHIIKMGRCRPLESW